MRVQCPNCKHTLDPNEDETVWNPPIRTEGEPFNDIGAIQCPTCGELRNFSDWILLTKPVETPSDR